MSKFFKKFLKVITDFAMAETNGLEAMDYNMEELCELATKGDPKAQYYLGFAYISGFYFHKDFKTGLKWLVLSANQYYVPAESKISQLFLAEAAKYPRSELAEQIANWAENAAYRSDSSAKGVWGYMLLEGIGTTKDYKQSIYFLKQAADEGITKAQYLLGKVYFEGTGVTRDLGIATHYLEMASSNKYGPAKELLEDIKKGQFN